MQEGGRQAAQSGPEPDQDEGNSVKSAEGLMLPDDCVAGGGTGEETEDCEALFDAFADGINLGPATTLENDKMDETD